MWEKRIDKIASPKTILKLWIISMVWWIGVGISIPLGALDPDKPINRYLLDEWSVEKGLTSETVEAVIQTPDGYLWLGTGEGLFRYDGIAFEHIYFENPEHKGNPHITALVKDKESGLWIGTKGLVHYKDGELKYFTGKDGFPRYEIRCLAYDSFGSLWIGTFYNSLYRFKDGAFTPFDKSKGFGGAEIYSILEDSSGNLWIACADAGLWLGNNGKFVKHGIDGLNREYSVYKVYEDRRGILWVGTNVGLVGIANPGSVEEKTLYHFSPTEGLSDNNVWSIREDIHGNLWVGTNSGLNRLKLGLDGKMIIEKRIEGVIIKNLFEDREENLWIGTIGSQLKRIRDGTFSTYWENAGVPYWRLSLHQDSKGVIRIGSSMGNLYQFDHTTEMFLRVLRTDNNIESEIYAIEEDSEGDLWLGTVKRGIIRFKEKEGKIITYTTANGLGSNSIRVIMQDSRDRIWIGTTEGIDCFYQGTFQKYTTREGLAGDLVFAVCEDTNNRVWIGTRNGINVLEQGKFDKEHLKTYLTGTFVTDILQDRHDNEVFWIGTNDAGLRRFKKGESVSYTEDNGLASNSVLKILEDHRQHLWIGSQDGISRLNKEDLNAFAGGKKSSIDCTVFGFSDGLKSLECRLGARNSAIKTFNGELWFGSRKGIAVVNPEKVYINKYAPPVLIKEVVFNYEVIPPEQTGRSFKGLKDLVFDFTAPSFVSPEKVRINYKLEGYDREWRLARHPSPRRAHYRNLPPGQYCFKVKACNSSGIWNEKGAWFRFTITPYFYQTLFFKILVALLALAMVTGFYFGLERYLYMRKLKKKYQHSTLDPQKAENCLKKLLYLLETRKLYRDETLSLNSLSKQLSIAPRYLSQVVNEQLNKNFRDLLNNFRIEEAKTRLLNPGKEDWAILEVAFEVGFNSKEVFNRCFKKYTGMTPSEFRKLKKNENNHK